MLVKIQGGKIPKRTEKLIVHVTSLTVIFSLYQSVMYPAAQALWSNWAPPNERSRLIGFSYAGGQFGNAIIFPIGGFLCAYGFDGGWPSVFYVIGECFYVCVCNTEITSVTV